VGVGLALARVGPCFLGCARERLHRVSSASPGSGSDRDVVGSQGSEDGGRADVEQCGYSCRAGSGAVEAGDALDIERCGSSVAGPALGPVAGQIEAVAVTPGGIDALGGVGAVVGPDARRCGALGAGPAGGRPSHGAQPAMQTRVAEAGCTDRDRCTDVAAPCPPPVRSAPPARVVRPAAARHGADAHARPWCSVYSACSASTSTASVGSGPAVRVATQCAATAAWCSARGG